VVGSAGEFSWGVVIPVKRLALAKTRLGAYGDQHREALALAFAADVVVAATLVGKVLVVTDDERAGPLLAALGAMVVADDPDAGLNPALEHGVELLRADDPEMAVAALSADLPALRAPDLAAVLRRIRQGERGFVADRHGSGTTLLAAGPGAHLLAAYGQGSRLAHEASGAVRLIAAESVRLDVDTPQDLADAVALGVGPHTSSLLAPS
jgi:2-phospho-L-lactate guanylyltransferase